MARHSSKAQVEMFAPPKAAAAGANAPLAERMRPRRVEEIVGQSHLLGPGRILHDMLRSRSPRSMVLWGPPGSGKTTLARLIGESLEVHWIHFSAVLSGLKELRLAIEEAREQQRLHRRRSVLFVDEIHRFNKAQQDAFLPHVEDGTIVLIGATTENPSFEIIPPLLSRVAVLVLEPLGTDELRAIVERTLADRERGLGGLDLAIAEDALRFLVDSARGDARSLLNSLEAAADLAVGRAERTLGLEVVEEAVQRRLLRYDKAGEEHHNVISAFIKSMRASDPDAAVYWLMRMLEAGEDPLFVARRMVIFAAEDVGNADPRALALAVAAKEAVHFVGMPEGRIPLAQAVTYLASAPKSNAAYRAMLAAAEDVHRHGALAVPLDLRNAVTPLMKNLGYGRDYRYPHDHASHIVAQDCLPAELRERRYYEPTAHGEERQIAERLTEWRRKRQG